MTTVEQKPLVLNQIRANVGFILENLDHQLHNLGPDVTSETADRIMQATLAELEEGKKDNLAIKAMAVLQKLMEGDASQAMLADPMVREATGNILTDYAAENITDDIHDKRFLIPFYSTMVSFIKGGLTMEEAWGQVNAIDTSEIKLDCLRFTGEDQSDVVKAFALLNLALTDKLMKSTQAFAGRFPELQLLADFASSVLVKRYEIELAFASGEKMDFENEVEAEELTIFTDQCCVLAIFAQCAIDPTTLEEIVTHQTEVIQALVASRIWHRGVNALGPDGVVIPEAIIRELRDDSSHSISDNRSIAQRILDLVDMHQAEQSSAGDIFSRLWYDAHNNEHNPYIAGCDNNEDPLDEFEIKLQYGYIRSMNALGVLRDFAERFPDSPVVEMLVNFAVFQGVMYSEVNNDWVNAKERLMFEAYGRVSMLIPPAAKIYNFLDEILLKFYRDHASF